MPILGHCFSHNYEEHYDANYVKLYLYAYIIYDLQYKLRIEGILLCVGPSWMLSDFDELF
jgi:hypothetical protein